MQAFLEKDQHSLIDGADGAGGAGGDRSGPDLALFGQRLRHARKARGLTLAELGAKVGRAPSVLSLLENGRREPKLSLIEGSWRIRDKSYEFQVSPLENNREMVVIQPSPDFVFPPGRYALVLNGYGYDFTVAGPITAPEQCLEQVQVVDGIVVSECPKS